MKYAVSIMILLFSFSAEARDRPTLKEYRTCTKAFVGVLSPGEKQTYNGRRAMKKFCRKAYR